MCRRKKQKTWDLGEFCTARVEELGVFFPRGTVIKKVRYLLYSLVCSCEGFLKKDGVMWSHSSAAAALVCGQGGKKKTSDLTHELLPFLAKRVKKSHVVRLCSRSVGIYLMSYFGNHLAVLPTTLCMLWLQEWSWWDPRSLFSTWVPLSNERGVAVLRVACGVCIFFSWFSS